MREFWDKRAREDPFYFVDDREPYHHADEERFWRAGERELDALLRRLGLAVEPGSRVMDVGCGIGRLTRVLARRAAHVTAVDISPEMLARAQELNPGLDNVEWVLGEGDSLAGIERGSHDAVVCHEVLQHIPMVRVQLGYVAEFARVLRPGGWAAFDLATAPARGRQGPETHSRRGFLQAIVGRTPSGRDKPEWRGTFVPLDGLGATAMTVGLTLERIEGGGTPRTLVRGIRDA
jgi:ubiquinone/menaquinone biosynthesis C-methylase UbiE